MAYVQTLIFDHDINTSLQIGDQVFKTSTSPSGGFQLNQSSVPIHIGTVLNIISLREIEVYSTYVDDFGNALPYNALDPNGGDYISFSKSRVVNKNDVLGYYATVHFENNSPTAAKLWSVATGITENSK
jgi:hypothetical protein